MYILIREKAFPIKKNSYPDSYSRPPIKRGAVTVPSTKPHSLVVTYSQYSRMTHLLQIWKNQSSFLCERDIGSGGGVRGGMGAGFIYCKVIGAAIVHKALHIHIESKKGHT